MQDALVFMKNLIVIYLINGQGVEGSKLFDTYQRVYPSTNENIKGYMSSLDFRQTKKVLTVLSSGDHVFNLVSMGVENIDTFDCNRMTELYALGLKQAAIKAFGYQEYMAFMNKIIYQPLSLEEVYQIIEDLLPYMSLEYQKFWHEINEFNYYVQLKEHSNISLFKILFLITSVKDMKKKNNYLISSSNYYRTKEALNNAHITFTPSDVLALPDNFSGPYDYIFLSNILDYVASIWTYEDLKKFEDSLKPLLAPNGTIALDYLYNYALKTTGEVVKSTLINGSKFNFNELLSEEIITFPHLSLIGKETKYKDGLLLKKYK